jgi:hypothetical protein
MADSKVREWMDAQDEQERDTIAIDIAGGMFFYTKYHAQLS